MTGESASTRPCLSGFADAPEPWRQDRGRGGKTGAVAARQGPWRQDRGRGGKTGAVAARQQARRPTRDSCDRSRVGARRPTAAPPRSSLGDRVISWSPRPGRLSETAVGLQPTWSSYPTAPAASRSMSRHRSLGRVRDKPRQGAPARRPVDSLLALPGAASPGGGTPESSLVGGGGRARNCVGLSRPVNSRSEAAGSSAAGEQNRPH